MAKEEIELFEMILDEDDVLENGVYAISIVDEPAIESNFVALKAHKPEGDLDLGEVQEVKFKAVDKEKRLIVGLVLVPDQPIRRAENGKQFYIYFEKDTIRGVSQTFLKKGYQNKATLQHQVPVNGASVVESWIVEDPEKDKTAIYGIEAKPGSWAVAMKVDSDKVWNEFIKTGKLKGFSIEGWFANGKKRKLTMSGSDKEKSPIQINMSKLKERIFAALNSVFTEDKPEEKTEVKLATVPLADGTSFETDGEFEVGAPAFYTMDGERISLEPGEYMTADNQIVVIDENSVISEIRPAEAAATEEAPAEDVEMKEEVKKPTPRVVTETVSVETKFAALKEELEASFDAKLSAIKEENAKVISEKDKEIEALKTQLSSQPAKPATKARPDAIKTQKVDLSKMSRAERLAYAVDAQN